MGDKLTDLKSELEKLKAVNVVTKNFVEGFNSYISDLFSKELDYEFISDNELVKNRLQENSRKMALFEIGLGNGRDEDFKNFIISIHLQIEDAINYYFKKKYYDYESFSNAFDSFARNEYQKWYQLDYLSLKEDFEKLKQENMNPDLVMVEEFDNKYEKLLKKNNPKSFYVTYEEGINKIQKLNSKKSIELSDYKHKLSLFEYENQTNTYKNNLRSSMNVLRNVLLHNVDDTKTRAKADELLNSKNFISCKDALKEIILIIKDYNN